MRSLFYAILGRIGVCDRGLTKCRFNADFVCLKYEIFLIFFLCVCSPNLTVYILITLYKSDFLVGNDSVWNYSIVHLYIKKYDYDNCSGSRLAVQWFLKNIMEDTKSFFILKNLIWMWGILGKISIYSLCVLFK